MIRSSVPKVLYLALFLIVLIAIVVCQKNFIQVHRLQPLEQDPFIQVYFNNNQAKGADYTDPYRHINRPGDNLEQVVIETIHAAKSTVDVAVQELRLPQIAQALVERHRAGIKVRVILENSYSRPLSELSQSEVNQLDERNRNSYQEFRTLVDINKDGQLSNQEIDRGDALVILQNANIPVIDDTADGSKGSGLMHHKFAIIDGSYLIVTSANFTTSDAHGDFAQPQSRGNANNLLKIKSPQLAKVFTEEFNLMWGDGPGGHLDSQFGVHKPFREAQQVILGRTTVTVHFSPTSATLPWLLSSNGLIGDTLTSAIDSVNLALFVFSEQKLADILDTRHQQGVSIKALIDPGFAFRNYSEALDMSGVALSNQCKYEADNRPWKVPINTAGVPRLPEGDKLHHKFGIVDGKIVITGSHNWSAAANNQNDETLLILKNPTIAAHYTQEFERLYGQALLGIPTNIKQAIQVDRQKCPQFTIVSSSPSNRPLINLNTATQTELEALPGVGAKLAQRIIETRQQQPFTSLADLKRVPGVGSAKLRKLEGQVVW